MIHTFLIGAALLLGGAETIQQPGARPTPPPPPPIISLLDASSKGLVAFNISGTGGSSGDVIHVRVRRIVNRPLRLSLPEGTVLRSGNATVQNMIVSAIKGLLKSRTEYFPRSVIELPTDEEQVYLVEAYCMDFEKENPGTGDTFELGDVNQQALTILRTVRKSSRSPEVIQAALWLTQGVPEEKIKERFTMDDADWMSARLAVQRSGIAPCRLCDAPARIVPSATSSFPVEVDRSMFSLGSSELEVKTVQGTPTSIFGDGDMWQYGASLVHFRDGRVIGYANLTGNLKVSFGSRSNPSGYISIGSTKAEVLAVHGTPTSMTGDSWTYGVSIIIFQDERVKSYINNSGHLRLK